MCKSSLSECKRIIHGQVATNSQPVAYFLCQIFKNRETKAVKVQKDLGKMLGVIWDQYSL